MAAAPLVLFAATRMEMSAVLAGLDCDFPPPDPGETARILCRGRAVVLAVTGVGPLAAALAAGRAQTAKPPPAGFVACGVAGAYAGSLAPLGSLVVASKEIWPEYGLVTETGVDPVALGFPLAGNRDDTDPPPVWNSLDLDPEGAFRALGLRLPADGTDRGLPRVSFGPSLTVAGVSGTPGRARALAAKYGALTENMEGFPLALAARILGVPFIELRSVSNVVGERAPDAWNMPAALASLSRAAHRIFS